MKTKKQIHERIKERLEQYKKDVREGKIQLEHLNLGDVIALKWVLQD